jgi:hypothetical protein
MPFDRTSPFTGNKNQYSNDAAREHKSSLHSPPAGNMLWRNIGIALGQRFSAHAKLKID